MKKAKITHSFEIEDSEYCNGCGFKIYVLQEDYYLCKIFNQNLGKERKGVCIELLRCPKCRKASVPVRGEKQQ